MSVFEIILMILGILSGMATIFVFVIGCMYMHYERINSLKHLKEDEIEFKDVEKTKTHDFHI